MALHNLPVLQKLNDFDRSLPEFHDQLNNALYGEEYTRCVKNLHGDDLMWLVDYLDKVCCRIVRSRSPLRSAQALDGLDPFSAASRKCLRELRSICAKNKILPPSYTLSSFPTIEDEPFASGGFGDVYRGRLTNGSDVCIKRVRVYTKDGPNKGAIVCFQCRCFRYSR